MTGTPSTNSSSQSPICEYWALPISGYLPNRDSSYLNPKPREDAHVTDRYNGIYILADGVTRTADNKCYPEPSPAALAAGVFVLEAHMAICAVKDRLSPEETLMYGARQGNLAVGRLNATIYDPGEIDYDTKDLGGACAILALIKEGKLFYLFNGDCVGYVENDRRGVIRFTPSQTERLALWKAGADRAEQSLPFVRKNIRNNPNHPGRYGVFTGESAALSPTLIDTGIIDLVSVSRIVFTSDGLDEILESGQQLDLGLPQLTLKAAEALEKISGSRSDDKTLVTLEVFGPLI